MEHKIKDKNSKIVISCYLSESFMPDQNAVAELYQMAALETALEKLTEASGFFQGEGQRIEKIIVTPDFHKGTGIPIGIVMMAKGFAVP